MGINWADAQRKQNQRFKQSAQTITEINKGYEQREDTINGWKGAAGQILLRYSASVSSYATFGTGSGNNNSKVGP